MKRFAIILPLAAALSACGAIPEAAERQSVRRSTATATTVTRPETRQCLSNLGASRAAFSPLPDKYYGAGCSAVGAVQLSRLSSDSAALDIANLGPVTCPLAETFAGWARFGVDRAARQILGSRLVRIETFGSYACRNVEGTGRRSAHATASAIDISGFVLADGRRITVLDNWSEGTGNEREFLQAVHASACKRFGTVLGPRYNAAHANHLHVELSGTGFCR